MCGRKLVVRLSQRDDLPAASKLGLLSVRDLHALCAGLPEAEQRALRKLKKGDLVRHLAEARDARQLRGRVSDDGAAPLTPEDLLGECLGIEPRALHIVKTIQVSAEHKKRRIHKKKRFGLIRRMSSIY